MEFQCLKIHFPFPSAPQWARGLALEEKLGVVSRCEPLPSLIQCPAQGALHLSREPRWCWDIWGPPATAAAAKALRHLLPGPLEIKEAMATKPLWPRWELPEVGREPGTKGRSWPASGEGWNVYCGLAYLEPR